MAKILVIDDNPFIGSQIKKILKNQNHNVIFTTHSDEGMLKLLTEDFDLVITDIVMPDYDGIDIACAIRDFRPEIPVIAMSAGAAPNNKRLSLKNTESYGVHHYLTKPFTAEHVKECIANALEMNLEFVSNV